MNQPLWGTEFESTQLEWVERPWGRFAVLRKGPGYQIKTLVVDPGQDLSLQFHRHRDEHWMVVAGVGRATLNREQSDLRVGDSLMVPAEMEHRLSNPGTTPFEIVEIQYGDYLGEDDIVRIEDRYGRA